MRQVLAVAILAIVAGGFLWASEPMQPLDCGDWKFLEPGYSCSGYGPYPCTGEHCDPEFRRVELDNEGYFYRLEMAFDVGLHCGGNVTNRVQLVRFNNQSEKVIAYVDDRCVQWSGPHGKDRVRPRTGETSRAPALRFDPVNGSLIVALLDDCLKDDGGPCTTYPPGLQVVSINGFTSIFDVYQTFAPVAGLQGIRVPLFPEGLPRADYFDTYWGDLATVGDWSQAKPLKCGYPASTPSVGDYLTVEDTLPTPARGAGHYYVTAAHYQGETRYGRKATGGKLSGRDPAVLPACE